MEEWGVVSALENAGLNADSLKSSDTSLLLIIHAIYEVCCFLLILKVCKLANYLNIKLKKKSLFIVCLLTPG